MVDLFILLAIIMKESIKIIREVDGGSMSEQMERLKKAILKGINLWEKEIVRHP